MCELTLSVPFILATALRMAVSTETTRLQPVAVLPSLVWCIHLGAGGGRLCRDRNYKVKTPFSFPSFFLHSSNLKSKWGNFYFKAKEPNRLAEGESWLSLRQNPKARTDIFNVHAGGPGGVGIFHSKYHLDPPHRSDMAWLLGHSLWGKSTPAHWHGLWAARTARRNGWWASQGQVYCQLPESTGEIHYSH